VDVLGLDHLVLRCRDVEATLAWYQQVLGLAGERVEQWRSGTVPFPSVRVDATTIIDLIGGLDVAGAGHLDHLCLVVSAADVAAIRAAGELVIVEEGQRFGAQGVASSIYVRDPDGLLVELRAY
jgi:catechol 2,3-dioxygenase-like lactoylglutathione lyase family enzyme